MSERQEGEEKAIMKNLRLKEVSIKDLDQIRALYWRLLDSSPKYGQILQWFICRWFYLNIREMERQQQHLMKSSSWLQTKRKRQCGWTRSELMCQHRNCMKNTVLLIVEQHRSIMKVPEKQNSYFMNMHWRSSSYIWK